MRPVANLFLVLISLTLSLAVHAQPKSRGVSQVTSYSSLSSEIDLRLPSCAFGGRACRCSDFKYQEDAQKVLDTYPNDPWGLDGLPGDRYSGIRGKACEHLPSKLRK